MSPPSPPNNLSFSPCGPVALTPAYEPADSHLSDRLLREGERPVSELCRFIHAEKANYPIVLL
ncbi:hypothetical protein, partial [Streptomyces sp. NPDC006668]|uniref:hypothetical protein n=1 Tax=Streptomyces sp. NPDC006668 TaxID=3156903 RepID=UPI00340C1BC0